jgi:spermidine synthase
MVVTSSDNIDEFYKLEKIDYDGTSIVAIKSNNSYQSVSYDNSNFNLFDNYSCLYDILPNLGDIKDVLVLGGGGLSYPKYYISNYLDKYMDVVEISQKLIDIAYKYFYLDKLYELYDPLHNRLNIICDDAYNYIKTTNKLYDGIFIDLYIDNIPLDMIYEDSFISNIKRILNNNKFVTINYIKLISDNKFDGYISKLKKYFTNVLIITDERNYMLDNKNLFIICSDSDIVIPDTFSYVIYDF